MTPLRRFCLRGRGGGRDSAGEGLEAEARVLELGQRLHLDLADALAREPVAVADLLERLRLAVAEPEAQAHDLALLLAQVGESARDLHRPVPAPEALRPRRRGG